MLYEVITLARNLADTLFTEGEKGAEIIFCGGVAKNSVVTKHLAELTRITSYNVCYTKLLRASWEK